MTTPISHLEEAYKFEVDALVPMYELTFKKSGAKIRFCDRPTITWQGDIYNFWSCKMDKTGENANGEYVRPVLHLANPDGIFTDAAEQGEFDLATLVRKDVRQDHLLANTNIYKQRIWFIARVASVNRIRISLECHSASDVPNFQVNTRFFAPPDFPFVVY